VCGSNEIEPQELGRNFAVDKIVLGLGFGTVVS
jgi:hypothetical protein